MFDLTGKVALVTGAGRGIGAGIARALARQGALVGVNDLYGERAAATVEAVVTAGGRALAVPFDVTDRASVEAAIATFASQAGPVDILVNNAGIPESMAAIPFRELEPGAWDPYIDVNLYGVLHCTKAVIDGMCERGWGRVITISSSAGTHGLDIGVAIYAAGKGGAISFMRHLACEVAASGVTANSLALGFMEKERTGGTSAFVASMEKAIPTRRLGNGDDVGSACVYLASEEASWMTGQTIGLNGGLPTT